jgi:hypothetical protein
MDGRGEIGFLDSLGCNKPNARRQFYESGEKSSVKKTV